MAKTAVRYSVLVCDYSLSLEREKGREKKIDKLKLRGIEKYHQTGICSILCERKPIVLTIKSQGNNTESADISVLVF